MKMSDDICDCEKATALLSEKADYNEFKKSCRLRSIDEILDMTDLYFRYHWACVEKRLKPETQTGNLNPDVVIERLGYARQVMEQFELLDARYISKSDVKKKFSAPLSVVAGRRW